MQLLYCIFFMNIHTQKLKKSRTAANYLKNINDTWGLSITESDVIYKQSSFLTIVDVEKI